MAVHSDVSDRGFLELSLPYDSACADMRHVDSKEHPNVAHFRAGLNVRSFDLICADGEVKLKFLTDITEFNETVNSHTALNHNH